MGNVRSSLALIFFAALCFEVSAAVPKKWKSHHNDPHGYIIKHPASFKVMKPRIPTRPDISSGAASRRMLEEQAKLETLFVSKRLIEALKKKKGGPARRFRGVIVKLETPRMSNALRSLANQLFRSSDLKIQQQQIGQFTVEIWPAYPAPYGDYLYFYVIPLSSGRMLTLSAPKRSRYKQLLELMVESLQLDPKMHEAIIVELPQIIKPPKKRKKPKPAEEEETAEEAPAEEAKPYEDMPIEEKATEEKPTEEKPAEIKPAEETPKTDEPAKPVEKPKKEEEKKAPEKSEEKPVEKPKSEPEKKPTENKAED